MCSQGEGGATAAAEQLVAEEAQEAVKAAAKKGKKQKANAEAAGTLRCYSSLSITTISRSQPGYSAAGVHHYSA